MLTDPLIKSKIKSDNIGKSWSEQLNGRGGGSLVLRVRQGPLGEFYYRYKVGDKRKTIKLGNYSSNKDKAGLTLKEARNKAGYHYEIYQSDKDVKNVLEQREAKKEQERHKREAKLLEGTLKQLIESYINQLVSEGKPSAKEVRSSLDRSVLTPYPNLAKKRANEITTEDAKVIIKAMIDNGITTQSNRVRSYLLAAFNHGLKQENNPRTYLETPIRFNLQYNPVANIPRQSDYERSGEKVIPDGEISLLWETIEQTEKVGAVMSAAIRFAFATGGRGIKQILETPWERYDLEAKTMLIHDTKGKGAGVRTHLVPLSDLAMDILNKLAPFTGACKYPFAGGSNGGSEHKHIRPDSIPLALQRFREQNEGTTVRAADIRRTCKTIMARNGIAKELRDRLHNHALNDIATKHYDKHDYLEEKRTAMRQWNSLLELIIKPQDNVVLLRRKNSKNE